MKRKLLCWILAVVLILGVGGFGLWYYTPVALLHDVSPDDVGYIYVFNGSTGKRFTISDATEIRTVIENLQSVTAKRDGLSVNYDGYSYHLTIMDKDGQEITDLIINSEDTVRRDPFFYEVTDGSLCYDYLQQLETAHEQLADSGTHSGYLENGNRWFECTVMEVHSGSIQIMPHTDTWEYTGALSAGLTVTTRLTDGSSAPAIQQGDVLRITYDGLIAETYPAQILKVYSIEILD